MPVQESQLVSQSVRRRLTNLQGHGILCLLDLRSWVCLCVATVDMACLSLDEVNGAL